MDEAELERLAELGLDLLLPVERLRTAVEYCQDRGETTGDARYSALASAFGCIAEFFEDYGAMEASTFANVNRAIMRDLGYVLHAGSAETGALLARRLREEITGFLGEDRLARGQ